MHNYLAFIIKSFLAAPYIYALLPKMKMLFTGGSCHLKILSRAYISPLSFKAMAVAKYNFSEDTHDY